MADDVATFALKGVVTFLLLELLALPLRDPMVGLLQRLLPPGYSAVWECTGLDEVLLFSSFLLAFPRGSRGERAVLLLVGTLVIEAYNALRIALTIHFGDPTIHDILFRWGGLFLVLTLFYASFKYLSRQR